MIEIKNSELRSDYCNRIMDVLAKSSFCPFYEQTPDECRQSPVECRECIQKHIIQVRTQYWRAGKNEYYWYINEFGETDSDMDYYNEFEDNLIKSGNYYQTETECEAAAERVRTAYRRVE